MDVSMMKKCRDIREDQCGLIIAVVENILNIGFGY